MPLDTIFSVVFVMCSLQKLLVRMQVQDSPETYKGLNLPASTQVLKTLTLAIVPTRGL